MGNSKRWLSVGLLFFCLSWNSEGWSYSPIFEGCDKNWHGLSDFQLAACHRDLVLIKKFLQEGADVNAFNNSRDSHTKMNVLGWALYTPATYPAEQALTLEIFNLLREHGATLTGFQLYPDYRMETQKEVSALGIAAYGGHLNVVEELIKNGFDVNELYPHYLNKYNESSGIARRFTSPLYLATIMNRTETVETLITKHGAKIFYNVDQPSLLTLAVDYHNLTLAQLFLDNGHRLSYEEAAQVVSPLRSMPTDLASIQLYELFEKFSGRFFYENPRKVPWEYELAPFSNLELAIRNRRFGLALFIVKSSPAFHSEMGRALNIALAHLHYKIAQEMILAGVDVNSILLKEQIGLSPEHPPRGDFYWDLTRYTPLQLAVALNQLEIVQLLIQHKADVNHKTWGFIDGRQMTLLEFAMNCGEYSARRDHLHYRCAKSAIVKELIAAGAQ